MHTPDIYRQQQGAVLNIIYFEPISPQAIFIRPPEKLVIEVKCRGRYRGISWDKNRQPIDRSLLSNHDEIYVLGRTTDRDFGIYDVNAFDSLPIPQSILPLPRLEFIVTASGLCYLVRACIDV